MLVRVSVLLTDDADAQDLVAFAPRPDQASPREMPLGWCELRCTSPPSVTRHSLEDPPTNRRFECDCRGGAGITCGGTSKPPPFRDRRVGVHEGSLVPAQPVQRLRHGSVIGGPRRRCAVVASRRCGWCPSGRPKLPSPRGRRYEGGWSPAVQSRRRASASTTR